MPSRTQHVAISGGVLAQEAVDSSQEFVAGLSGQSADRLLAEDRLKHLLAGHRGASGHRDLGAGQSGRLAEDREHDDQPGTVDAVRRQSRPRPLRRAFGTDQLEHVFLPVADQPLDGLAEPGGRPGQLVGQQRCTGLVPRPAAVGQLSRLLDRGPNHGRDAGLQRLAELLDRSGPPGYRRHHPVADPPHPRLQFA